MVFVHAGVLQNRFSFLFKTIGTKPMRRFAGRFLVIGHINKTEEDRPHPLQPIARTDFLPLSPLGKLPLQFILGAQGRLMGGLNQRDFIMQVSWSGAEA